MNPLIGLPNITLNGQILGAYREPLFRIDGVTSLVSLYDIIEYLSQNGGGGGGANTYVDSASLNGADNLILTLNDSSTVQVDLSSLEDVDTNDFVTAANLDGSNNLILTLDSGGTVLVDLSSLAGGGGGNLLQYEASGVNGAVDNGAFITTTDAGITYERTGGAGQNTEGILTVPAGAILQGAAVHFSSGQAPGNTFYLNVDYLNTGRPVNGTQDSVMPVLGTVASKPAVFTDGTPATNFVHSGTPLQIGIAQVDDNGTRTRVRYKIQNYSQQVGSNASILSLIFP